MNDSQTIKKDVAVNQAGEKKCPRCGSPMIRVSRAGWGNSDQEKCSRGKECRIDFQKLQPR
jgi:hypothetical protein